MKCIILAAGYGTRLYPLTKNTPKPLIKIADKPIIEHILEKIIPLEEIDKIYVVTNAKFFPHFQYWLQSYNSLKEIKILNDGTLNNDDRLGAIGDINFTISKMKINDDLLVIAGDNLFDFSLKELSQFYKKKKSSVVALYDLEDKNKVANKYGVVEVNEESKIIGFEEKPVEPKSSLASTACYIFSKSNVEQLVNSFNQGKNIDNLGHFIKWLAEHDQVHGFPFKGKWFDIGSFNQLEEAKKYLKLRLLV